MYLPLSCLGPFQDGDEGYEARGQGAFSRHICGPEAGLGGGQVRRQVRANC